MCASLNVCDVSFLKLEKGTTKDFRLSLFFSFFELVVNLDRLWLQHNFRAAFLFSAGSQPFKSGTC